jgi:hypothetical protein
MDTIARRAFLGVAGLGVVGATAGAGESAAVEPGGYGRLSRPIAVGLGRGQAASLTFVWLPRDNGTQRPPLKARLAIFDLGGKVVADSDVALAPFTGASVEFTPPSSTRRSQVFGYVFIEGLEEIAGEIFGGIEVFDVSSGRASYAAAPIGIA